ncbi:MAG: hypothetical protein Q7K55_05460 [Candidatus Levybacteria bacterium]|nr:hypothetical protein [Candidatus Levybacteria bacterium]
MALKRNMTQKEMEKFIDNELIPQAKLEIENWIKPRKKQGGYFVTTRQILCMVDFLGAAYAGYPFSERKKDPKGRRISTSEKAINFITTFFEPKQTYQTQIVTSLYTMYRHGLVHLYQPKFLKLNSKKVLRWFFYKGKRNYKKIEIDSDKGKIIFHNVEHLKVILSDPKFPRNCYLPISIDALYEDFEKATQAYKSKLSKTKYLQTNWRTTVNAICKPR